MATKIMVIKDGPAIIDDDNYISITNQVFKEAGQLKKKIALCRCGKSQDGVYCDGSHVKKSEKIQENG